jgi:SAM-dependent methyltransferase
VTTTNEPDWLALNRANWDERVALHMDAGSDYDLSRLHAADPRLDPIVASILGSVSGLKVAHLQCHFGLDTLVLARQGAEVVGVDFSAPAIETARRLALDVSLPEARFVQADIYDAPAALAADCGSFDRVLVSWGALCWLPDMAGWARVIAALLRPGGCLALAEAHPAAYVFDDANATPDGRPGWYLPYLGRSVSQEDEAIDYANPAIPLSNTRTSQWLHPLSDVMTGLLAAGLRLDRFEEFDRVPWRMFRSLVSDGDGFWRWPDRPWLPLSYAVVAAKPVSSA